MGLFNRPAAIAALFLTALAPALAAGGDDEAVKRARAELTRRLHSAGVDGDISVRDGAATPPAQTAPPKLRTWETAGCLTVEMLAGTETGLGPKKASSLDALRHALLSGEQVDRSRAELALARAYLVLGFTAEARAIASARPGAEAAGIAGLAMLAEGENEMAAAAVRESISCGALYDFVLEAAVALGDEKHRLSKRSIETLSRLPQPLRQPIAEALAIDALEAGDEAADKFTAIAATAELAPKSSAGALLEAIADQSNSGAATATLTSIGATPGPLRAVALSALAERVEADAPPETAAALDADIAEAAETSPLSQTLSALNLTLAERRIARRDFAGAARAIGAAFRDDRTRGVAVELFAAMIRPLLSSANADDRLAAVAAAATQPEIAAAALPAPEMRVAASSLADLGAVDSAARLLSSARLDPAEKAMIASRALVRAGQVADGRARAMTHADDPRAAGILLQTAFGKGEADIKADGPAAQIIGAAVISGALWRTGEFAALRALKQPSAADPVTAKRMILAFLAARETPPRAFMAATATIEGASALFVTVPDPLSSSPRAIDKFSQRQKSEIAFLRRAVNDE